MPDRVLDQRLQQQRGHGCAHQRLRQLEARLQPRPHAHRHQRQVVAQPVELGAKRVQRRARTLQGAAQEADQVVEHGLRLRRVERDEHAQVGQRIEQNSMCRWRRVPLAT
jgi:hypothetical protein